MLVLPWTPQAALATVVTFAVGIGAIAIVLVIRSASADNFGGLIAGTRLA